MGLFHKATKGRRTIRNEIAMNGPASLIFTFKKEVHLHSALVKYTNELMILKLRQLPCILMLSRG